MRRDEPEICIEVQTNIVTVTGNTWPLQLLLTDNLDMTKEGPAYTKMFDDSEVSAGGPHLLASEITDMATTFGWRVDTMEN